MYHPIRRLPDEVEADPGLVWDLIVELGPLTLTHCRVHRNILRHSSRGRQRQLLTGFELISTVRAINLLQPHFAIG